MKPAKGGATQAELFGQRKPKSRIGQWMGPALSIFWQSYHTKASGEMISRMGRVLRPLYATHGEDQVLERWRNYCTGTPLRYYSAESFGIRFSVWEKPAMPRTQPGEVPPQLDGESIDAYIGRLARLGF